MSLWDNTFFKMSKSETVFRMWPLYDSKQRKIPMRGIWGIIKSIFRYGVEGKGGGKFVEWLFEKWRPDPDPIDCHEYTRIQVGSGARLVWRDCPAFFPPCCGNEKMAHSSSVLYFIQADGMSAWIIPGGLAISSFRGRMETWFGFWFEAFVSSFEVRLSAICAAYHPCII